MTIEQLAAIPMRPSESLVFDSGGGAHAAQGWVFLRARGFRRVVFLRGGLAEWLDQVMRPVLPADAGQAARVSELSRYFGGRPRAGDASGVPLPVDAAAELRRRGC